MRTFTSSRTPEHFVKVARLIAGKTFPEWLPRLLHCWMCDLHRERSIELQRPTRAEIRRRLCRFEATISDVLEGLESGWVVEFLNVDPNSPLPEPALTVHILEDLARRAHQAKDSNSLVTTAGVTRLGSGKARSAAFVAPKTYCALLILETYKFFHRVEPLPKNQKAAAAAEVLWCAAGGEAHSDIEEPFARWRYHFRLARQGGTKLMTAEYRRHLVENDHSWKLLHGVADEAA
jgi:hypothetical protein